VSPELTRTNQCQKPSGWLGRLIVWNMNSRHSKLTDWGLSHVSIQQRGTILDVGCGGGKTVGKLAAMASEGKVYGLDYSNVSVAMARKLNARLIREGRVEICEGSVSELPFNADMFDLITAVETHFWWPDLLLGICEVRRVLKPGGAFIIIAEIYKGAATRTAKLAEHYASRTGMKLLTPDEHRELLANAGYSDVQIVTESNQTESNQTESNQTESKPGWICAIGKKPFA
jgi:ubiquinone/menaquinone biosynthesis C-methylase UbiE